MKVQNTILLLVSSLFFSCKDKKWEESKDKNVVKIYSPEDFGNKIKVIDTFCINETRRARQDIKDGKIYLNRREIFDRPGYTPNKYFYYEGYQYVLKELAKLNIMVDTTVILNKGIHSLSDNFFKIDCYQAEMAEEVYAELKFHSISLDTLIKKAERQYVLNHPDKIFSLDERDYGHTSADNYFSDFEIKSRLLFAENFIYPNGYVQKKEKSYSYTTANFVLMKNGTIKNLKVESTFQNSKNEKFRLYFESKMKEFVQKTKWVHPKFSGILANSEMSFIVWHK